MTSDTTQQHSLSDIWRDTQNLVRREAHLLGPVTMATIGIGQAGAILLFGQIAKGVVSGSLMIAFICCWLLGSIGQLAITVLIQKVGMSVAEGLRRSVSLLPKLMLIAAWIMCTFVIFAVPLTMLLAKNGLAANSPVSALQASDVFILMPLIFFMVWSSARLYLLYPTLTGQNRPAMQSLLNAFRLTKGRLRQILPVMFVFYFVGQLIQLVIAAVATLLFAAFISNSSTSLAASTIIALVSGTAGAIPVLMSTVFAALYYDRIRV